MADTVVSFAIENLGNLLIQEGQFLYGVKDQVEEMQTELKWMQCFMKDAEARKGESELVRNWVSEIREAIYDVEDLIEHFALKSALKNHKGFVNRIKNYACCFNNLVELHQVGSGIEGIKEKLTNLRTRLQTYGIKELGGEESVAVTGSRKRQEYAHVVDHNVVGLDAKITEIVELLIDGREAPVVCISGMGGIGKTTTAKQVYNDNRIETHFEVFAWVYVSQQFNHKKVWGTILTQLSDKKNSEVEKMSEDELTSELCRLQKDRRCLVVMDDIWETQDWAKLSPAFPYPDGEYGSKILFTTRNKSVATHKVKHTEVEVLDFNTSLKLLTKTVLFLGGPDHPIKDNADMKRHAEEMVGECGRLPLAITVLGGVLATKHEIREWERVGENIKPYLNAEGQEGKEGVARVLESSYEDLPRHLKTCFLYFSQYPEDEEIRAKELIQKWIGEGFISSSMEGGGVTVEEIGEGYLNELVSRCMVQAGNVGHMGRVKTCRVHDLVRDLCVSKAKEEGFAQSVTLGATDSDKVSSRRVCVTNSNTNTEDSVLSALLETSTQLRSMWFRGEGEALLSIAKKLKLVRVLELESSGSEQNRTDLIHIGNLIHLRFLKFQPEIIDPSIGKLRCLETLILWRGGVMTLPDSIWGLAQLRHLYLSNGCECESSKQPVCNLPNLQTFVNFPPHDFDLEQNLVKLTSVRKLVIGRSGEEICEISRRQGIVFNRLESLYVVGNFIADLEALTGGSPRLYRLCVQARLTFEATVWPSGLTKLVLMHSRLAGSHMAALAKLQSLRTLFLKYNAFSGKEMIFEGGDFPRLHHLVLDCLTEVEECAFHRGAVPSLFCLEIESCEKLKSVPDGTQFLEQLKEIKIRQMRHRFVKRVEQGGDDWGMVSHVPSISIHGTQPDPTTARPSNRPVFVRNADGRMIQLPTQPSSSEK